MLKKIFAYSPPTWQVTGLSSFPVSLLLTLPPERMEPIGPCNTNIEAIVATAT
jgi:hypothetical protein